MVDTIKNTKFYPQIDEFFPEGFHNEINHENPFNPDNKPEPPTSPIIIIDTNKSESSNTDLFDYLETDLGRFSKFKNVRLKEEFSIHDQKGQNKLIILDGEVSQLPNRLTRETQAPIEVKGFLKKGFVLAVLTTIFTVEFGKIENDNIILLKNYS